MYRPIACFWENFPQRLLVKNLFIVGFEPFSQFFFGLEVFCYFLSFSVRWSQIIVFFHVKTPQFRLLIAAGKTRQTTEHSSFFSSFLCKKKIPSDLALDRERSLTLAYFSYSILCRRFAPRCAAGRASHSDLFLII